MTKRILQVSSGQEFNVGSMRSVIDENAEDVRCWKTSLEVLYNEFWRENGKALPANICPFSHDGSLIRVLISSHPVKDFEFCTSYAMATLVVCQGGTGNFLYGRVEDVFTRQEHRGRGFGRVLMEKIIHYATIRSWRWLELTSRPSRVAANQLYQNLGFVCLAKANPDAPGGGTNYYRLELH